MTSGWRKEGWRGDRCAALDAEDHAPSFLQHVDCFVAFGGRQAVEEGFPIRLGPSRRAGEPAIVQSRRGSTLDG